MAVRAFDENGRLQDHVRSLLGQRTPLKELYVQRFCLTLAFWLGGIPVEESSQRIALSGAIEAVEEEIDKLDPERQVIPREALEASGDGALQPCHHKAFRRYDIIISSIGAGKWRGTISRRGKDGFDRADVVDRLVSPIEAWLEGKEEPEGEPARSIYGSLGEPDAQKRFLAAFLASLLRAQEMRAREIAGKGLRHL